MQTHLEESLQRDIDRIRRNVVVMAGYAETALQNCVKACVNYNRQLAYAVIMRDQFIDEKEKEIDRQSATRKLRLPAHLQQQMASTRPTKLVLPNTWITKPELGNQRHHALILIPSRRE